MNKKFAFLLVVVVLFGGTGHAAVYWTPEEISTTAWFDAADASTIATSGSDVTKWNDKSGNGFDLNANVSPETGTVTQNGLNVLAFAEGDKMSGNITLPSDGNVSSFLVFDFISTDSTSRVIHQFGGNQLLPAYNDGGLRYGFGNTFDGGHFSNPLIAELVHDNDASRTYGYVTGDQRLDIGYTFNVSDGSLRLMRNANGAAHIAANVGEFVIVPDSTPETRLVVEGYLAHKWGLEADLPADHPFKTAAPTMLSFDNGGPDSAWGTAANWDPDETPISTALVTIDSGDSVTLTTTGQAAFSIDIGETTAGSALSVSGDLTLFGATVGSNGSLDVTGTLVAPTLNTAGTVTVGPAADISGVAALNINGGSVLGAGALTLGAVNLNAGTLGAGGTLTVDTLNMTGGAQHGHQRLGRQQHAYPCRRLGRHDCHRQPEHLDRRRPHPGRHAQRRRGGDRREPDVRFRHADPQRQ